MYTPGKIATALNDFNRKYVFYPFPRDHEKDRTSNFCQFWRWNFYAIVSIIVAIIAGYGTLVGIISFICSAWTFMFSGDISAAKDVFQMLTGALLTAPIETLLGAAAQPVRWTLIPFMLIMAFGTMVGALTIPAFLVLLGVFSVVTAVTYVEEKLPTDWRRQEGKAIKKLVKDNGLVKNVISKYKDNFCPMVKYDDE